MHRLRVRLRSKRLTVVLGTSSIVDEVTHEPILSVLSLIVETAIRLRRDGHRVVIVSSGAIGVGLQRMKMAKRPKHLAQVQALAAIGQCKLMSIWDDLFAHMNQPVAQILLTRNDIADRSQYINATNTLTEVLSLGVIPIVNENDTVAVSEIKFGDNDTLSAITAAMVHADYLFLMTDVDCLYDKNPRKFPDAKPVLVVDNIDELEVDASSGGSALGTGGMVTKITAARLATSAGTSTIITKSSKPGNIGEIIRFLHPPTDRPPTSPSGSATNSMHDNDMTCRSAATPTVSASSPAGPPLHTLFTPSPNPIRTRAFWILHALSPLGTIYIDRGAASALLPPARSSLLPSGIVSVSGQFAQQECVRLVVVDKDPSMQFANVANKGEEIGRAVVNYSSAEISRIKGLRSSEVERVLGYADSESVAFRGNISLLNHGSASNSRPATPLSTTVRSATGTAAVANVECADAHADADAPTTARQQ
ncbi:hypothetical protein DV736_g3414, partial [Chaetothyriales sp. CBS 134916]